MDILSIITSPAFVMWSVLVALGYGIVTVANAVLPEGWWKE